MHETVCTVASAVCVFVLKFHPSTFDFKKEKKKKIEKLECVICELLAVDLGNLDEIDLFVDFFF